MCFLNTVGFGSKMGVCPESLKTRVMNMDKVKENKKKDGEETGVGLCSESLEGVYLQGIKLRAQLVTTSHNMC